MRRSQLIRKRGTKRALLPILLRNIFSMSIVFSMLSSVITKLRCKNSNLFFYNLHLVRKILFFFTLLHISAFLLLRKRCSDIVLRQSMRTESTSSATCQKAVRHVATNRSTRVSQSVGTCQPIGRHVAANRSARGSKQRFNRYRSAVTMKSKDDYG